MSLPGLHPETPLDFNSRTLPRIAYGGSLYRTHLHSHEPFYFGRTGRNRFDDLKEKYGVLYAARDLFGASIETFGQETGRRTIGVGDLKSRLLTEFHPATQLALVDLFSSGCLARIGADSRLFAGDRTVAQRWSRAIYDHPDRKGAYGIIYPARHDHVRSSIALFDVPDLPRFEVIRSIRWYSDDSEMRSTLSAVLNLYGFSLVETESRPDRKGPGVAKSFQFGLFDSD